MLTTYHHLPSFTITYYDYHLLSPTIRLSPTITYYHLLSPTITYYDTQYKIELERLHGLLLYTPELPPECIPEPTLGILGPRDCHRTPGYDVHSYSRHSS